MRKIYLYGDLEEKYGNEHSFECASLGEALRALNCAYNGFMNSIKKDGLYTVYNGSDIRDSNIVKQEDLALTNTEDDYHIVPVISGSKSQTSTAITFAVIGIALVGVGWGVGATIGYGLLTNMAISMGAGMILSGISMLIAPTLKDNGTPDEKSSFLFSSADNVSTQGGPVPLVYGRHRAGSTIISTSLEAVNV